MPNINPVAFSLFGLSVNWYGIIIAFATLLAIILCSNEAKRIGLNPDSIIDLALLCIPIAIVFARIYYVVFEWDTFNTGSFIDFLKNAVNVRSGGLAIYGAVIGGLIAVFVYSRWKKIAFWKLVDIIAPSLILAQGLGRWGNFFNQEAYGNVITNPAWQFFPAAVFIPATGNWHMATFFYESIWCILAFFVLFWFQRKSKKSGNVFALYLVLYGFERMIVEGWRMDSLWWGSFRVSQVLSGIMFAAGLIYLLVQHFRAKNLPHNADDRQSIIAPTEDISNAETEAEEPEKTDISAHEAATYDIAGDETGGDTASFEINEGENLWAQEADEHSYKEDSSLAAETDDN
ncbi:MAG: prolipoprotein diacylglyceryl transferase [Christensenellales bacterium]|jgi:phosphatidylglycerol:prolipoprotein diacylglycerol transferase